MRSKIYRSQLSTPHSKPLKQPVKIPLNIEPGCVLNLTSQRDSKWYDYSRYDNHGLLTNALFDPRGRFRPAVYFDGTGDYVNLGNDSSLDVAQGTDPWTIESWILFFDLTGGTYHWIIGKLGLNFGLYSQGPALYLSVYEVDTTFHYIQTSNIIINRWYYIVGLFDGDEIRIYLDGILEDSESGVPPLLDWSPQTYIGSPDGATLFHEGLIDEARIYNRVLSSTEIKIHYEAGRIN